MKCLIKLPIIWIPLASANCRKANHVGSVHSSGLLELGGGKRWGMLGLTRDDGGNGEGERSGWLVLYDSSSDDSALGRPNSLPLG